MFGCGSEGGTARSSAQRGGNNLHGLRDIRPEKRTENVSQGLRGIRPRPETGLDWLICSKLCPQPVPCELGSVNTVFFFFFFFFFTLDTGPRRPLGLDLSDTTVSEPQIRVLLGFIGFETLYAVDGCFGDLIVPAYWKTHVRAQVSFSSAHTT